MKGIKRKLIFICLILVTVLVFCFVYFNINTEDVEVTKVTVSDVESIEWNLYDNLFQEDWYYTVDFVNKTVSYRYEGMGDENETSCYGFTDKEAEYFIEQANIYGFFDWEEEYFTEVEDGGGTEISVKFTDGSVHETYCSNEYPPTYDQMSRIFLGTFGS